MSFCCLRPKLYVHFRGKYVCNDSMQCSYTVCYGVQFYAVLWFCLWEHNEEQNLCIWKVASVYTIVSPSPQRETCLLALNKKVYQVICNFWQCMITEQLLVLGTGWKRFVGLHILYFAYLLNFSPHYILYAVYVHALSMVFIVTFTSLIWKNICWKQSWLLGF